MPKQITADGDDAVTIDGHRIPGWISGNGRCATCGAPKVYHEHYDAFFCPACNAWLDEACADQSCAYCRGRPLAPLPADAESVA